MRNMYTRVRSYALLIKLRSYECVRSIVYNGDTENKRVRFKKRQTRLHTKNHLTHAPSTRPHVARAKDAGPGEARAALCVHTLTQSDETAHARHSSIWRHQRHFGGAALALEVGEDLVRVRVRVRDRNRGRGRGRGRFSSRLARTVCAPRDRCAADSTWGGR